MPGINIKSKEPSALVIKIVWGNNKGLFLFSIYKPCQTRSGIVEKDVEALIDCAGNDPFVIGGDFNTIHPSTAVGVQKVISKNPHMANSFTPRGPTFRTGSKLDYFFAATNVQTSKSCKTYDMCLEHKAIIMKAGLNMFATRNPLKRMFKW